jgi:hypothetical protein
MIDLCRIFGATLAESDARRLEHQGADAETIAISRDVAGTLLGDSAATLRTIERLNRMGPTNPPATLVASDAHDDAVEAP